jgi:serine/threonine-protein kinase HipA
MALHLVGETIDAKSAHRRAQQGELLQLIRGVYIERADAADALVLRHAVRIAHYLYPQAYLSSASSVLLGPTPDGRLFLAGRRNQRTRLRSLEIVQNEAPAHPSTAPAIVADELGELRIDVSSPRQRFLEAFRMRSEHATAIDPELRRQLADRLVAEYGTPQAAADAVWALARENQWYREGEGAERYLLTQQHAAVIATRNEAALDFDVAWHGHAIGTLHHDGFEWRWRASATADLPPLVRETKPGRLPAFIESLLPEGWLENVLSERDERDTLRHGRRYMSNITIVPHGDTSALPPDVLTTPLSKFIDGGSFTGRYAGPARGELNASFEQNLALLFERRETPRLSGVQIKAPMSLLRDGSLVPAVGRPFTHILKPAGTAGFEQLPLVEWLCLELGRVAGFDVPAAALVAMPDGMLPALVVERFDVRRTSRDLRMWALEDFCSVLDLPAAAKYDGTIERAGKALRALSTDSAADLESLLRRAIFAWLIADGDMHLKNLALLKTARLGSEAFSGVRLAPLYDAVSTRVFPKLAGDRMALKLNGKDDRLTLTDFSKAARTMGIPVATAEAACSELTDRLSTHLHKLQLPTFARRNAKPTRDALFAIVEARTRGLR